MTAPDRALVEALEAMQSGFNLARAALEQLLEQHDRGVELAEALEAARAGYGLQAGRIDDALARYREGQQASGGSATDRQVVQEPHETAGAPLPVPPTLTPALLEQIGEESQSWREGFAVATAGMDARRPTVREWCSTAPSDQPKPSRGAEMATKGADSPITPLALVFARLATLHPDEDVELTIARLATGCFAGAAIGDGAALYDGGEADAPSPDAALAQLLAALPAVAPTCC